MMGDVTCVKFLEHRDPKIVFLEIGLLFDVLENILNTVDDGNFQFDFFIDSSPSF